MKVLDNLKIKIFADGADLNSIKKLNEKKYIKGFTTNPSLMRKAGIKDYKSFAKEILREINDKPISFEVFSDEIEEMKKQAEEIATWGSNVNVKIPVTNTKKYSTAELIKSLSSKAVKLACSRPNIEILWASTRETLNIFQAEDLGCHIITVPHEILNKLSNLDKNLDDFSLDTVKSFYKDAVSAGFKI